MPNFKQGGTGFQMKGFNAGTKPTGGKGAKLTNKTGKKTLIKDALKKEIGGKPLNTTLKVRDEYKRSMKTKKDSVPAGGAKITDKMKKDFDNLADKQRKEGKRKTKHTIPGTGAIMDDKFKKKWDGEARKRRNKQKEDFYTNKNNWGNYDEID